MATSDTPGPAQRPPPSANKPSSKSQHQADFYDTQFIVKRLKDDQRKSRFRFYLVVALLALVITVVYTLTARRAEAPKSLKTEPVVVPAPSKSATPAAPKAKAPKPTHK